MPVNRLITLYSYDELCDAAKEQARADELVSQKQEIVWYYLDEAIENDVKEIARRFGLIFKDMPPLAGCLKSYPAVYYTIGDGHDRVSFSATYAFEENAVERVKEWTPLDERLHRIVQTITDIQAAHQNTISGMIIGETAYYSFYFEFECEYTKKGECVRDLSHGASVHMRNAFQQFAYWIRDQLREDYDHYTSDSFIEREIREKEYLFDREGNRITEKMLETLSVQEV